jgi:hypothetical protein
MVVRSSIRGNAAAAKSRRLSQAKKRYVISAAPQAAIGAEGAVRLPTSERLLANDLLDFGSFLQLTRAIVSRLT